ncbi:uncharacterized protein [Epargyreus clarus]|uniref:uncharacterized protein n=1 Tax=Epargyreus clarus TaxID=520877 RepID=UPI003C30220D
MALLPYSRALFSAVKCTSVGGMSLKGSIRNLISKQLVYSEFGDPLQVVKFREVEVPPLDSQEVLVRMLAAPVNPADINTIQGKYPVKVNLPCIPGNEGVGIIEEVGKDVKGICPGNKVIVTKPVQGTWRDIAAFKQDVVRVVPDGLGTVEAATLTVNPCTAYRMLTDFKPVRDGLVVIQNGANSACGQNVIQLCKAWGVKNVNIVRNRPEIAELKKYLECLGATYVLTEEEVRSTKIFKDKEIDRPVLALNCVGGKSSLEMLRQLQHSGTMVTYGGMSREPVNIPTSAFIFKNLSFYGFWMTAWNEKATATEKDKMIDDIVKLMCEGKLKGPAHKMVKFSNYEEALGNALTPTGFIGRNLCLPCLPSIPGDEGVGEVVEIGDRVCTVELGDRVVLTSRLLGTWRYYGVFHERDVHVISSKLPLPEASMLTIAPCNAYRMLRDFKKLKPGDTVIQNAANSPCGQCVIQLCKAWGINTFNIVANHCGYEEVKEYLMGLGATAVYTIEEAEALTAFDTSLSRPVLGLNCLGGRFEDVMIKLLDSCGVMVYYGCAFDLPIVKQFVRPDVNFERFHLCDWDAHAGILCKDVMMNDIVQTMVIGKLRAPIYQPIELKNYVHAFRNTVNCEAFATINFVFDLKIKVKVLLTKPVWKSKMEQEYETYQFLTTNRVDNDLNTEEQFYIVQDNCTLMTVDKPIQYITQLQDGKQVIESIECPVYDSQPYYIDLNTSSGLVPITVQGDSIQPSVSVYENNYLLPTSGVEMIPENGINLIKQTNENMIVDNNKQADSYAEITLSDEQYETLRQKGWILLELKDKAFLLDSSGLHEITNDPRLIERLKQDQSQIVCSNNEMAGCSMKVVMIPTVYENTGENVEVNEGESMDIGVGTEIVMQDNYRLQDNVDYDEQVIVQDLSVQKEEPTQLQVNDTSKSTDPKKKSNRVLLKSQYLLKDIPKEIVLGKTVNGKNLIARVVKGKGFFKTLRRSRKAKTDAGKDFIVSEKDLAKLVQQVLQGTAEKCRDEDITAAEAVVTQLGRVPDFTPTLPKENLIITKTTREENEDGLIDNQTNTVIITGRLVLEESKEKFVHIPDMLNEHMKNAELEKKKKNDEKGEPENLEEDMFLHINITETKSADNISRISVIVNRQYLPLAQIYKMKTKLSTAVYACSACAKVFKTNEDLENHQEYKCPDAPIFPDDNEHLYTVVKTRSNITIFMCKNCNEKFIRRKDCQKHVVIHSSENDQEAAAVAKYLESVPNNKAPTKDVHKCKMCPNTYFHSSSLTKHILAKHINIVKS